MHTLPTEKPWVQILLMAPFLTPFLVFFSQHDPSTTVVVTGKVKAVFARKSELHCCCTTNTSHTLLHGHPL